MITKVGSTENTSVVYFVIQVSSPQVQYEKMHYYCRIIKAQNCNVVALPLAKMDILMLSSLLLLSLLSSSLLQKRSPIPWQESNKIKDKICATYHIVWKFYKMSHLNFGILAYSTNFLSSWNWPFCSNIIVPRWRFLLAPFVSKQTNKYRHLAVKIELF